MSVARTSEQEYSKVAIKSIRGSRRRRCKGRCQEHTQLRGQTELVWRSDSGELSRKREASAAPPSIEMRRPQGAQSSRMCGAPSPRCGPYPLPQQERQGSSKTRWTTSKPMRSPRLFAKQLPQTTLYLDLLSLDAAEVQTYKE